MNFIDYNNLVFKINRSELAYWCTVYGNEVVETFEFFKEEEVIELTEEELQEEVAEIEEAIEEIIVVDIPEVTELTWYLNCFMPFSRLQLAHSFKDKSERTNEVNAGLFSYPVLMAADILLYDAEIVPVGKDQLQHLEMTRDVASRFHSKTKSKQTFVLPQAKIQEDTKLIPGTDGEKMSKSRNNIIDIFLSDKKLRKQIMTIKTDSTPLEAPKNWKTCNCFALYSLLGNEEDITSMKQNYENGNYGYGHAKQALYELILEKFQKERERYNWYMANIEEIDKALAIGANKASAIANNVLKRVRKEIGY